MLELDDDWIWDFWFARDGADYHVFFLKAPRALRDPDLRHRSARIGHAVSTDLRRWTIVADALGPGPDGAWDDVATWTGCVLRQGDAWNLFYTGIGSAEGGLVQRIGLATSPDLHTWTKIDGPLVTADARWYELLDAQAWDGQAWRDPWVFRHEESGRFHMLITARANHGPADARGVIGHAQSEDLRRWEVLPPLTEPGDYGHMEVPQLARISGRCYLFFSVDEHAHSATRRDRVDPVSGTHYLVADDPLGPWRSTTDEFFCGSPEGPLYSGKVIQDPDGRWVFLAFEQYSDGRQFVGRLADPAPIAIDRDGTLRLA